MVDNILNQDEAEQILIDSLKFNRFNLIVQSVFMSFGSLLFLVATIVSRNDANNFGIMAVITFAIIIFTLFLIKETLQGIDPINSPVYKLLKEAPEKIVWIYNRTINHKIFGIITIRKSYQIIINDEDKKSFTIRVRAKENGDKLYGYLLRELPLVMFGYTEELVKIFAQEPKKLLEIRKLVK